MTDLNHTAVIANSIENSHINIREKTTFVKLTKSNLVIDEQCIYN